MNELSLFSGAGGSALASLILGHRVIGYVERDVYCQRVLAARIADGILEPAPIFRSVEAFIGEGYAERYRGVAELVTAGFPCQPFSVAGKRSGGGDARNLWPQTAEVLGIVRPRLAFLENVGGLLSSGYFETVLGDLAALGFDAEWIVLSAADVGAPHIRARLWVLAYAGLGRDELRSLGGDGLGNADESGLEGRAESGREHAGQRPFRPAGSALAHPADGGREETAQPPSGPRGYGSEVANAAELQQGQGRELNTGGEAARLGGTSGSLPWVSWPPGRNDVDGWRQYLKRWPGLEPVIRGGAHGLAYRVDRLRALGNGWVPQCAAAAFHILLERALNGRGE